MIKRSTQWVVYLWMVLSVKCPTVPFGCSYASSIFTCDFRFALPLDASLFDPKPQQLKIIETNGLISSADLINFGLMSMMTFDSMYAASLEIRCSLGGGILTFTSTSFLGFDWVQELTIVDCEFTNIPERAFANFVSLNTLLFEGGTIDVLHPEALKDLNIAKDFKAPEPRGQVAMINTKLIAGRLPAMFFANSRNLTSVKLCNIRIRVLQLDLFSGLSNLAYITLSDNPFTYLKDGTFHSSLPLGRIDVANIDWFCSCSNLWFIRFADTNKIQLSGEMLCALPNEWKGKLCLDRQIV